ncbi:cation diffusion facilitator family transporter [Chitinibacter sp. ZOR0017]|uniref:cation diffusion facilitator family transporter n=1 Tax=Chitinibacter sp. ZOR0017 TaxID=1339254 RepID=UPI000647AB53|nr:cation diffusion facilitator family transporter [Chitinibacter sp. ZOR0017]
MHDQTELNPVSPAEKTAAKRSLWVSVAVNLALTTIQGIVGLWAGSQALVADALHSFSDLLADFVAMLAGHHSQKAADDDHHYGHHRYETAAALVLGLLLIAAGAGMLWGAATKISGASPLQTVHPAALVVALIALLSKELLFRYMLAIAERVRSSMLVANAWHARADAASSLVVALGIAGNLLGYPWLDPIAAILVGFMIGKSGLEFAWNALSDLMDRAADEATVQQIEQALRNTPGVQGLHDLRTRKMGDMVLVDVHLEIDGQLTVQQGHAIAVAARTNAMAKLPVLDVMTHVDPV